MFRNRGDCTGVNPIIELSRSISEWQEARSRGSEYGSTSSSARLGSGELSVLGDHEEESDGEHGTESQSSEGSPHYKAQWFSNITLPLHEKHFSDAELPVQIPIQLEAMQLQDVGEAWAREFQKREEGQAQGHNMGPIPAIDPEELKIMEMAWNEGHGPSAKEIPLEELSSSLGESFIAVPLNTPEDNIETRIAKQSFFEEIRNDQEVTLEYLNKATSSQDPLELAGIGVYKRALTIIAAGNMEVTGEGTTRPASENSMPTSSYLCHGARVLIEIPEGEENDRLFNWLTSGDQAINGASDCKTQSAAAAEGKYVYNRYAATHGIAINEDGLVETKGFLIGARDGARSMGSEVMSCALSATGLKSAVDQYHNFDDSARTNHYGIDLTLGIDEHGQDRLGHVIKGVDGDHGHLYIYYLKPTASSKGAILLGVEGSSPDSPHHSKLGASDPHSPSYGSLWEVLAKKKGSDDPDCVIGDKNNGRKVKLTQGALDEIVKIDVSKVNNEKLVASMPSKSVDLFLGQNMQSLSSDIVPGAYVSSSSSSIASLSGPISPSSSSSSGPSVSSSSSSSLSDFESSKNFDPLLIDHPDQLSNQEEPHKTPSGGGGDHDDDDGDNEGGPGNDDDYDGDNNGSPDNDDDDGDDNEDGPGNDEAVDAPVAEAEEAEDIALAPTANNDDSSPNIALILSGLTIIMLYAYSACDDISDYDGSNDYGSDVGGIGAANEWMLIDPV